MASVTAEVADSKATIHPSGKPRAMPTMKADTNNTPTAMATMGNEL
jgi:hypothetical protein